MPRQYSSRANAALTDDTDQQADAQDDASESGSDDNLIEPQIFYHHLQDFNRQMEDQVEDRHFFNHNISFNRTMEIRSNISLSMQQDDMSLLLSDNGANASLISTHAFHIDAVATGRLATIKGCKEDYVSTKHQIGTGRSILCFTINGHDYEAGTVSYTHLTLPTTPYV